MQEAGVIAACKKGDPKAQKDIFDTYSHAMLWLCKRYVRNVPDAEELMLNGFFHFFDSIERFVYRDERSIGAWLKKIMINECLMFLRKRGKLLFLPEAYGSNEACGAPLPGQPNVKEILPMIMALPDGYRTVFNLYVLEGMSHKEIAKMLMISEGTSKSQLSKARSLLQKNSTLKDMLYGQ